MDKIKKTFKKTFLPLLIASLIFMLLNLLEARVSGGIWELFGKLSRHRFFHTRSDYFILYGLSFLIELIFAIAECPFLCGIYSFCFARLNDEKKNIDKIFYFYRSFKRIIMSVVPMKVLLFFSDIQITFRDLKSMHTTEYYSAPAIYTFFSVFGTLLYIASRLFLYFWQFAYAENPERGLITALNKSRCCILAAVPTLILFYFLEFIYLKIISIVNVNYLIPVYSALRNWIGFTIYYMATGDGINSKIFKKTFQKINEKEVERAKNEAYNIGGNYVYATNTPAENDKTDE